MGFEREFQGAVILDHFFADRHVRQRDMGLRRADVIAALKQGQPFGACSFRQAAHLPERVTAGEAE